MKNKKLKIIRKRNRTIKIKRLPESSGVETHKDWIGPIKNKRALHVPNKSERISNFNEIDSLENASTYDTITKDSNSKPYRIGETILLKKTNQFKIQDSTKGESFWYKKTVKDKIKF